MRKEVCGSRFKCVICAVHSMTLTYQFNTIALVGQAMGRRIYIFLIFLSIITVYLSLAL